MLKKIISLLVILVSGTVVFAQQCYVFVGSYNTDKTKNGIYVFSMNTNTGELTPVSSVKNVMNPSFISLSPNGKYLYACTDTRMANAGNIASYGFNQKEGTLSFINSQSSGGDNPVYVSPHPSGKWLIAANYYGGSAAVFPVDENGVVAPAAQVIAYKDSSINKERQERSHIHSANFSPDGRYAYFPDLGADKIRIYRFMAGNKTPLHTATPAYIKTIPGSGPRHFAVHPNQKYAYCITELNGAIEVYRNLPNLQLIQNLFTHPANSTETFGSADIHISPDGRFLYASNRGTENNIAIYSIQKNGTLQLAGYEPSGGEHPRNFGLSPDGKFLLAANMNSGDIVVFKRNAQTGLLQKTGFQVKVFNPSVVVARMYP